MNVISMEAESVILCEEEIRKCCEKILDIHNNNKVVVCATKRYIRDVKKLLKNKNAYDKESELRVNITGNDISVLRRLLLSMQLEKLRGHDELYKFRVNNTGHRIICSFGHPRYPKALIFRAYVHRHDSQGRIAKYIDDIDNTSSLYNIEPNLIENEVQEQIDFQNEELYYYKNNIPISILSEEQETIKVCADTPLILKGSAGSGKTLLSIELYKKLKVEGKEPCYITYTESLLEYAKNEYELRFDEKPDNFFSLKNFFINKSQVDKNNIALIDFDFFKGWKSEKYAYSHNREKFINDKIAWTFIRGIIKGKPSSNSILSEYDFISFAESEQIQEQTARAIYKIALDYEADRKKRNQYDDNDLAKLLLEKRNITKCKSIIIDEAQDLTYLQTEAVINCLQTKDIFFIGDPNQTINPTILKLGGIERILCEKHNLKCDKINLKHTYRMGQGLMNYVNYLSKLRKEYIGSQDTEDDEEDKTFRSNDEGLWAILCNNNMTISKLLRLIGANYIIIVSSEEEKSRVCKILKDKKLCDRIETVHSIKGREYENVIVLNFFSDNAAEFKDILHRKKRKQTFYRMLFNELYVACTRAQDLLIFCEEKYEETAEVIFKNIPVKNNLGEINRYLRLDNSEDGWVYDAKENEKFKRYNQAVIAYKEADKVSGKYEKDILRCTYLQQDFQTEKLFGEKKIEKRKEVARNLYKIDEYEKALEIYEDIKDNFNTMRLKLKLDKRFDIKELQGYVKDKLFSFEDVDQYEIINNKLLRRGIDNQKNIIENIIKLVKAV